MKSRWKKYLLYASLIIVGGCIVFILVATIKAKNTGFETKTLWDWMELLIIPLFLAGGAFFLNRGEKELEREIAQDRQREAALQAYIDKMSDLLLEKKLRTTKEAEVREVARTRTISVMRVLDTKRNDLVIQFLREAKLINDENSILNGADMKGIDLVFLNLQGVNLQKVNLQEANLFGADFLGANLKEAILFGADLRYANLQGAHLFGADLQGAKLPLSNLVEAELQGANLVKANLSGANLQSANLVEADLRYANLQSANLVEADLSKADLEGARLLEANLLGANLRGAILQKAFLAKADLSKVVLEGADMEEAILFRAKVTDEQLADAKSLKGAAMPDATKHE